METTTGVNGFSSSDYAFTTWNIDEVISGIIQQSANKYTPNNTSNALYSAKDWMYGDYKYIQSMSIVSTYDELVQNIKTQRSSHAQSFIDTTDDSNDFALNNIDNRFHWYCLVLFYDKLLNEGLVKTKSESTKENATSTSNKERLDWITEQLGNHTDRTNTSKTKEIIKAELSRSDLSRSETSDLLKSFIDGAKKQLKSCDDWFLVVNKTKEEIAQAIVDVTVQDKTSPFISDEASKLLLNFQKAYAWNDFVNWLIQKRDPYVPFDISILYRRPEQKEKDEEPTPLKLILGDFANEVIDSTNKENLPVEEKSFGKPAVALMFVYLKKMGYFNGTTASYRIKNEEALKYNYSSKALYNAFNKYDKENIRINPQVIQHIKKAIKLLKIHDGECWDAAIDYAQADLTHIGTKYPTKA